MHVLIADDETTNRLVLSCYLQRFEIRISEAINGRQAIELARQEAPDLILMDIGMPVVSGIEATLQIKSQPETSHIPILAFSGHTVGSQQLQQALDAGCEGFIRKPVDMAELEQVVNRYHPERTR